MAKMLIIDAKYNTLEVDSKIVSRIIGEVNMNRSQIDIRTHGTQTALFDDIRAYLKREKEE